MIKQTTLITIKLRSTEHKELIIEYNPNNSLKDLCNQIINEFKLENVSIKLKLGFPPKFVESYDKSLTDLGVTDMETILFTTEKI